MANLDKLFSYPLEQVNELVAEFQMIVDKRMYMRLDKDDTQLFINIDKHITEDEYVERNSIGIAIEDIFEKKYGEELVSRWRNEI